MRRWRVELDVSQLNRMLRGLVDGYLSVQEGFAYAEVPEDGRLVVGVEDATAEEAARYALARIKQVVGGDVRVLSADHDATR